MKMWHWVAALSILLAGCSKENGAETSSQPQGSGRPLAYASNYPLKYFAERISAPLVDVRLPVPAGEDPVFWKPAPKDVLALQQADLVVLNSNPLDNIRNTADILYVIKGGIIYAGETLDEIWPEKRPFGDYYWVDVEMLRNDQRPVVRDTAVTPPSP